MGYKIEDLSQQVAGLLLDQQKTLALAESCTGGWVAKSLTDLAGSSQWFLGGVVSYSNEAKKSLLGVDAHALKTYGAVSEQVAKMMAAGSQSAFSSDCSLSITGIAGPTGGDIEKPVGLVWFGLKIGSLEPYGQQHNFSGNRDSIRQQAVAMALKILIEKLVTEHEK